jgi:hypothetical protein
MKANGETSGIKESPEINSHIYHQIIIDKGAKTTLWNKTVFATNGTGKTRYPHTKEYSWTTILTTDKNINSRWVQKLK